MKNKAFLIFFFLSTFFCFGQQNVTWEDLAQVTYSEKYFASYEDFFLYPDFLPSVRELEGELITIKGYFLNIDAEENLYVLSKGPMSSCFFCGQGGPETTIELQFTNKENFKTDNIVAITGRLKLNEEDVEHFNYILVDCEGQLVN